MSRSPGPRGSREGRPAAYCSPVEDQGSLGSCTANAVVGIVEYFERRAYGKYIDASRLFLYKATRDLLHWTGDTGAYLRSTIGALALFGVPPEEYWPYKITNFDTEPTAFCYAFANDFRAISVLPARRHLDVAAGADHEDQGGPRRGPPVRVRLHRLQLDRAGGEERPDPVSGPRARRCSAATRCS